VTDHRLFGDTAPPGLLRDPPRLGPTAETGTTVPQKVDEPDVGEVVEPDRPWVVIVWNDPVNLMSYVVYVLQKLFHYSREKATRLMLDVHHKGKAVVSHGNREQAEADVSRLHAYGLWATMQRD
jgi:ATP-dependent Clp protease adaptor protein ClpS